MKPARQREKLLAIFDDDEDGIFDLLPAKIRPQALTTDERLVESFLEVSDFYKENKREPEEDFAKGMNEWRLATRLKEFRGDFSKCEQLKRHDEFSLLAEAKVIESIDDIFDDPELADIFGLDDDEEDIFTLKHVSKERDEADYVAKRTPCDSFENYAENFKAVQADLKAGKRHLKDFKEDNIHQNRYYIINGMLAYLEDVKITSNEKVFNDGSRSRKDGRTRCIFENGTESDMLYRSFAKSLYANGKIVTENADRISDDFVKGLTEVNGDDKSTGFIYVLKSLSELDEIAAINNLHKIGFSRVPVMERIKNASKEATYLMAEVKLITSFECYNMNPQKLEKMLHKLFGKVCLDVDVHDEKGKRCIPREWFIVPLSVIEQAITLIIEGKVMSYYYDEKIEVLVER